MEFLVVLDNLQVWAVVVNSSGRVTGAALQREDENSVSVALILPTLAHAAPGLDGVVLYCMSCVFSLLVQPLVRAARNLTCGAARQWIRRRATRPKMFWSTAANGAGSLARL